MIRTARLRAMGSDQLWNRAIASATAEAAWKTKSVVAGRPRHTQVCTGARRGNWVLVSAGGQVGWVSGD